MTHVTIDKRVHKATKTILGCQWIWDWYKTEKQAMDIVGDNEHSFRDKTRDDENGFCVASK